MMSRGEKLLKLQEVENMLRDKIADYKQVKKLLTVASPVRQARVAYQETASEEKQTRAEQQDINLEWQGIIQKVGDKEKLLYSGKISNPKELENLQLEVESLKTRREKLEEQALDLIERVDELVQQTVQAKETYEQVEQESREQHDKLEKQEQDLRHTITDLRREREQILTEIDPTDLDQYRYVQRLKNDTHAVAILQDGICGACHIQVSASKRDSVERVDIDTTELFVCGNCGRILVHE